MISTTSIIRPNTSASLLRTVIVGGCLLAFAGYAQAHTFCAANAKQLRAALAAVSDGGAYASEDDTIYISGGTHHTDGNEFLYTSTDPHTVSIIGTGTQDCGIIKQKAALTRIDGDGKSRVFETHSTQGAVQFQYLTIQNGHVGANQRGGGLSMNAFPGDNGQPLVGLVIIRDNHADIDGGFFIGNGGNFGIDFENNLVVRNSANTANGAGEILNGGIGGYGASIISNTFARNTVAQHPANEIGGLSLQTVTSDTLSNNIFWNNSGYDLNSGSATLVDNDYDTDVSTPAAGSSGNHHLNPHFVAATNFRLTATSPLLGVGTVNPVGGQNLSGDVDLQGKSRVINNKIDLGAYERQAGASATEDDAEDDADDAE